MKIYYFQNGEIWNAILKRDEVITILPVGIQTLEVDEEMPENKDLIIAMSSQASWRDITGLGKWYMSNGVLYQRENWKPFILIRSN